MKLAIISAAGYHGYWTDMDGQGRCPESMLPITSEGDSTATRLAKQFRWLGFTPLVAVGRPGCLFKERNNWYSNHYGFKPDPDITISPWTWELVDMVREVAIPLLMPDPDNCSVHDTFCRSLDMVGYEWDKLVLFWGDHLITTSLLSKMLSLEFPTHIIMSEDKTFKVLLLTPDTAMKYRELAEVGRKRGRGGWIGIPPRGYKEGAELAKYVPIQYMDDILPGEKSQWSDDIDSFGYYSSAKRWLDEHGGL